MKRFQHWLKKWMVNYMDLPADVIMDLPRLTMIGQLHVYIENHRGVVRFTNTELRLALKEGELVISGNQFIIKTILPEEILLEGIIEHVYYEKP
ncbi:sporulation protein YqfC [Salipaludibacillus agaradhaerens]|jgi:sporulation protein YqfC|uniref:Sporulation protein YqfC n=1 Tax=Salipaludibacillus agaradhaerens TaxID=76935 RepID=A0A9Q4B271_SALAG|nr:sporulation protein YqfC [Salipaludibacillus agaradhaerens]UJW57453.1 sporulation protein YqfC [Bacillus sp. A116_S68]MCR6096785.1 sporulation protein YqfC [Salipaludibacillus agaradhaerens]MCR6106312.1 sporulation protein YqfC [Salipaludibacillus agaradhaerens]MCR6113656.1 sporulation protein YqfC [Salipaludibacillus agaradhaerens]MCR6118345.1 sporulation protein YqfC [Salipaludibacillus agaradhaerens]